ncbi:hypothetical protein [Dysgonomonas sp. 511]|uniref:hypothetical protein n=1 Tax=Dysgonomonas sp. 511 TaxID=2302930 RepID=UPI0013D6FA59|nr:hypothetical protein [Dysgonomonas sp. 511]NDV80112.1 hypothetical protein [Dysgonomonas sp. 511]
MSRSYLLLVPIFLFLCSACSEDETPSKNNKEDGEYYFIYEDVKKIEGVWSATLEIDSIVLIFEVGVMKQYIYEKGTKNILDRIDHGGYALTYYPNGSKNYYIILDNREDEGKRWAYRYKLDNNVLTIYNEDHTASVNYQKK